MRTLALLAFLGVAACAASTEPSPAGRFDGTTPTDESDITRLDDAGSEPGSSEPTGGLDAGSKTTTNPTENSCTDARDLGSLSGDAAGSLTAQGTCSEWLKVRVLETRAGAIAAAMKLKSTLVSTGMDFDLHVYVDASEDTVECTTETAKSENPIARSDTAEATWGEGWLVNGSDDSRTVSIEVRAKDPASCGKGQWVLVLDGNE